MMHVLKGVSSLLACCLALGVAFGANGSARAMELGEKAALQAVMHQHVDRLTVDDAFLYFDARTAEVRALYPVTAHPMIMEMGEYYVLCFDFLDTDGRDVEVDFYLAYNGHTYVVFHTAVASRGIVEALMEEGKVTPAE